MDSGTAHPFTVITRLGESAPRICREYTLLCTIDLNPAERWLRRHGCAFVEGAKHTMVYRGSRFAPRYSEQQAMEYAVDAIQMVLNEYIRRRRAIPTPSKLKRGMRLIPLPAVTQAKLVLYVAMTRNDMRKADLARRLGWHKFQVERLLDLTHASRMDQIEAALSALGKRLVVNAA